MSKKIQLNSDVVVIQLTPTRLEELLNEASKRGAAQAMVMCGVAMKDMFSRAELSKKFGRGKVDRYIRDGKLIPYRMDESARPKYKLSEVVTLFN